MKYPSARTTPKWLKGRAQIDGKIVDELKEHGFPADGTRILDLPGKNVDKSVDRWTMGFHGENSEYAAAERDPPILEIMKRKTEEQSIGIRLCEEFWTEAQTGRYDVLKFCTNRTLKKTIEEECLIENLANTAKKSTPRKTKFALIMTFCRRNYPPTQEQILEIKNAIKKQGWLLEFEESFPYGCPQKKQAYMVSYLFIWKRRAFITAEDFQNWFSIRQQVIENLVKKFGSVSAVDKALADRFGGYVGAIRANIYNWKKNTRPTNLNTVKLLVQLHNEI